VEPTEASVIFHNSGPPTYTMRASAGSQTMVLSYQPCVPSQFFSVPPVSDVLLQFVPPFHDTHSSLWALPCDDAYR